MRRETKTPVIRVETEAVILPKLAFRVEELVHVLGLGKTTIWDLISSGRLAHIKVGKAVLVTLKQLEDFLDRMEHLRGRN